MFNNSSAYTRSHIVSTLQGSREQTVWFRFQQIKCAGPSMAPPCAMVGRPQYWDTYWWTHTPASSSGSDGGHSNQSAIATGFYASLLENR